MHPLNREVFINCPFDEEYEPLFSAILFTVVACGFQPRCALEKQDSGEIRLTKILNLIKECSLGIHDISRTSLDSVNSLPRFNMPFELGLFLGMAYSGHPKHRGKLTLIFDLERYRYQKFLSDIAGQDIKSHGNDPLSIIDKTRDWLQSTQSANRLPGKAKLKFLYKAFQGDLPKMLDKMSLKLRISCSQIAVM